MEKLLANIKHKVQKLQTVDKIIDNYKHGFNNFKNNIDRKYALYDFFGYFKPIYGFEVTKFIGSNQVILTKDNKQIYNSDNEGNLTNPEKFERFFEKLVFDLVLKGAK